MDKKRTIRLIAIRLLTPILMSLLMNIINAMIYQGVSFEIMLTVIAKKWPVMMILAIALSQFVVIPFANAAVKAIAKGKESKWIDLINTVIVVLCMSALMTFAKQITMGVPIQKIPRAWIGRWPKNFMIAFVLQSFVVGPLINRVEKKNSSFED